MVCVGQLLGDSIYPVRTLRVARAGDYAGALRLPGSGVE